jgi:hypothetical protein
MAKTSFVPHGEPRIVRRGKSLLLRWKEIHGSDAEFQLSISSKDFEQMTGRQPEEMVISYVGPIECWNSPAADAVARYFFNRVIMHGWFPEAVNRKSASFLSSVRLGSQQQVKPFVVQGSHYIDGELNICSE